VTCITSKQKRKAINSCGDTAGTNSRLQQAFDRKISARDDYFGIDLRVQHVFNIVRLRFKLLTFLDLDAEADAADTIVNATANP
jgi:hypothetical protein